MNIYEFVDNEGLVIIVMADTYQEALEKVLEQ